ncbi:MAG: urease subunit beta [Nitrososphaerales archaeon]
MIPGEYILASEPIIANKGRKTIKLTVKNTGDRPVQIGSHTHFFEVNKALDFDRKRTLGFRLNIPAGTAIRFEPGDRRSIELAELGGKKVIYGFHALVQGNLKSENIKRKALRNAKKKKFKGA